MLHGSQRQRAEHLPAILRGDSVWCQAFSEPGAGSDLASLTTRGVVDGDVLIVRGQKIWTSFAQFSDYAEALIRTEPDSERHRGLSLVIVDMHAPGVEVRPIEQIDGNREFCEVFFDDVRVPLHTVVGELGAGWEVALSTLALERGPAVFDLRLASVLWTDRLVAEVRARGLEGDTALTERLAFARASAAANRALAYYHVAGSGPDARPGPETTAVRAFHVELEQEVARLGIDVTGSDALEWTAWSQNWLHQFMATIAGGTIDVQRNIIGERVMGLPR
jgi:alkylation response protein AidB-like acyl-CoA dehydrogenase